MYLRKALGIKRGDVVAFTGAGGKTSALLRLSEELRREGWRVLLTTTTRVGEDELALFPYATALDTIRSSRDLSHLMTQHGAFFLYERLWGGKALGVSLAYLDGLVDKLDSDAILIEADGARRFPFKAPYEHEPVVPDSTTLAVIVAGMDILGQPLDDEHVYNPDAIIERYGFPSGEPIRPAWVGQVLRDETLGLKGIPPKARVVALLNKTSDSVLDQLKARRVAQVILHNEQVSSVALSHLVGYDPVWEVQRRIGAIVLAGGMSRRMGQPKQLLPWGKSTVIATLTGRLLPLRFADIVVVTGHAHNAVRQAIAPSGVRSVHNTDYETGEMLSSLQTGLQAFGPDIAACMIFLGDQPQINARLVHQMMLAYAQGEGDIVAPSYMRRRGHPILIDRRFWRELLELPAGSAPRDVVNRYNDQIAYILTDDINVLEDMDTPEQYRAALKRAGLL
ncbi:MAG: selenium cofactor biosynthesis protein YqeC [Anaerolineales bacterium]